MGWHINLVKNELPISEDMARDISTLPEYYSITVQDGKLFFNRGHLEHMDYMWHEDLQGILAEHRANGEVLFSSSDGDNAGQAWGYRFEDGVFTKLVRAKGEWIADDGQDHSVEETGNRPATLEEAQPGDTVAVAVIYMGLTSYEESTVGDILPDGKIVVDGREYEAPGYRYRGDMGMSFKLVPIDSPEVELEE